MRLIKGRGQDPEDGALTYHGSPQRRVILKAGMQASRIRTTFELEGSGATRNHDRDAQGPRTGRP
jgi:hypothetical protein